MKKKIGEGDNVLLYLNPRRTYLVRVEKSKSLHTHKGFVQYDSLIGKEYGTKVTTNTGIEFVALRPALRDYIFKVQRKTQIMYPKDIALIVMFSGIGPGSRVVEARKKRKPSAIGPIWQAAPQLILPRSREKRTNREIIPSARAWYSGGHGLQPYGRGTRGVPG